MAALGASDSKRRLSANIIRCSLCEENSMLGLMKDFLASLRVLIGYLDVEWLLLIKADNRKRMIFRTCGPLYDHPKRRFSLKVEPLISGVQFQWVYRFFLPVAHKFEV
jgi:hypothetical protein